jgi:hypothetical protein
VAPPGEQTAAQWRDRFPFAASELVAWSRAHPQVADQLAAWEQTDPDQARALVAWAVTHVYDSIDVFLMQRSRWGQLRAIRAGDREGLDAFLEWCRRAPAPAAELVNSSAGISAAITLRGEPTAQRGEPKRVRRKSE